MVTMQAGDLSSAPGTLQPFHSTTPSPHTGLGTAAKQKSWQHINEMGKGTKTPAQGTVAGGGGWGRGGGGGGAGTAASALGASLKAPPTQKPPFPPGTSGSVAREMRLAWKPGAGREED